MTSRACFVSRVAFGLGLLSSLGWASQEPAKQVQPRSRALNFDIRTRTLTRLPGWRRTAPVLRSRQAQTMAIEKALAREKPGLNLTLNVYGLPQSISQRGGALSAPSSAPPETAARAFLRDQVALFLLNDAEVASMRLLRSQHVDGMNLLVFNQTLNDVNVFQGQLRVVLNAAGQVVEAGAGSVIPGLSVGTTPRLSPETAVRAALKLLELPAPAELQPMPPARERQERFVNPLGANLNPVLVERSIFPLDAATAVLAYRILLEVDGANWYEMLVNADTGELLFTHNLYRQASGRVWRESPVRGSREQVEFPADWLPEGRTVTSGNNVDAYVDANGDNAPDSTEIAGLAAGRASSDTQQFDFPTGDRTTLECPRDFRPAAVTNLFYYVNLAHDYFYQLGFDEASGNFQKDNFGRGGADGDPMLAEAQDGATNNNANTSITPDGTSPRIQAGLFTYGSANCADYNDSDYDGAVLFHEYTHGVTNRIIGAGTETSCLAGTQSGALGEGWSDYFAISYFNNPVAGEYVTRDRYKGIRRASYEHYPFTYEDLGNQGFEVHNDGEIWAATLWDIRKSLGQEAADRLILAALRLTPCNPSFPAARDAILEADENLNESANRAALWTVFARHGLGYGASGVDGGWRRPTVFTATYDLPPDLQPGNQPPIVTSGPLAIQEYGSEFVYQIQAEDPDGDELRYEVVKGPEGLTVDPITGRVSWQPTFSSDEAQIAVTDGHGGRVLHGFQIWVEARLSAGSEVLVSGREGTEGIATINVPPDSPALQITLRGGGGDADVYLSNPNGIYTGFSLRVGNTETLTMPAPMPGTWMIEVYGYRNFWDVSLAARLPVPARLGIPARLTGLSGEASSETFYQVTVPPGDPTFQVRTSGGSGDVDLYVKRSGLPVCQPSAYVLGPCTYDARSSQDGSAESITIDNSQAADYFINLVGYGAYSDVTLDVLTIRKP